MIYLPVTFLFFIFLLVLLPFLIFIFGLNVTGLVFEKLNLSPNAGFLIYFLCLLGSTINIPIKKGMAHIQDIEPNLFYGFFLPRPPRIGQKTIVAINLGGAIIPVLLSVYLLTRTPIFPVVICTVLIALITNLLARPVKGLGIAVPALVPPLFAALLATAFSRSCTPCVAYISGVLGTLIGADILNLHRLDRIGAGMLSIGGAGVFDGIFLTGIIAVLLV